MKFIGSKSMKIKVNCCKCGKQIEVPDAWPPADCFCGDCYNNNDRIKQTNPKDAVGVKKVPFSTVPAPVIAELGLALLEGARKYGRHNYRVCGVRASVYYDAVFRHITSWFEGEDIDEDSGLSHVIKAIACLVVLRDSMLLENWVDDRPPKVKQGWVKEMNKKAAEIINKYPDAVPPFLEKNAEK